VLFPNTLSPDITTCKIVTLPAANAALRELQFEAPKPAIADAARDIWQRGP
jgi:hypothetical protein